MTRRPVKRAPAIAAAAAVVVLCALATGCSGEDTRGEAVSSDQPAPSGTSSDSESPTGSASSGGQSQSPSELADASPDPAASTGSGEPGGDGDGDVLPAQHSGVLIGAAFSGNRPHNFGTVPVGSSVQLFMAVRNTTGETFEVTSLSVTGEGFSLVDSSQCQGAVLASGGVCTVTIVYRPGAVGVHVGKFSVSGLQGEPPAAFGATEPSPSPNPSPSGTEPVAPGPPVDNPVAPTTPQRKERGSSTDLEGTGQ